MEHAACPTCKTRRANLLAWVAERQGETLMDAQARIAHADGFRRPTPTSATVEEVPMESCPDCKTHRATIATLTPLLEELKAEKKTLQEQSTAEQKELASLRAAVSAPEKLLEAHRTGCTDESCATKAWYDTHDRAIVEAALKDPVLVNPAYAALQPKVREAVYK